MLATPSSSPHQTDGYLLDAAPLVRTGTAKGVPSARARKGEEEKFKKGWVWKIRTKAQKKERKSNVDDVFRTINQLFFFRFSN
jgi:hypothetical protein